MEQHRNEPSPEKRRDRDPENPTATAPDSVEGSVPDAAEGAGKIGPDAADPPRTGPRNDAAVGGRAPGSDPELDPEEGADAFETYDEARRNERETDTERRDEDQISMDPPD